ncbi:MAG: YifB family Mg chelatase-like AAA ATPase [Spirochaetia bacterium]
MFAEVSSFTPLGIDGRIVSVEIDIRRGLPGIDIVGLPDSAVREAKERVRVAIRNSGFRFPADRILVNLAPADIKKEGASFDLPIALGILAASSQIRFQFKGKILIIGELNLAGKVKPVRGVLSAVVTGLKEGFRSFFVPHHNLREAKVLGKGTVYAITDLRAAAAILTNPRKAEPGIPAAPHSPPALPRLYDPAELGDFCDIKGQWVLKRALEIAAAGRHHLLMFGPPGSGKTMSARRLSTIIPALSRQESVEVTRIHSVAGLLPPQSDLISYTPLRMPHHSASNEGILGGGKLLKPGEVSLAHRGILFLDEAPEFKKNILQGLREPIEQEKVIIARAGFSVWFPSSFQLVLACNPCACGNLGRQDKVCLCGMREVSRYWKKIGGALLDRIDIRIPVKPVTGMQIAGREKETSKQIKSRVERVIALQRERFAGCGFSRNSQIPPGLIDRFCSLNGSSAALLSKAVDKLGLSSRAYHSIVKIARTIADFENKDTIGKEHVLEAVQHRRYGDDNFFWESGW